MEKIKYGKAICYSGYRFEQSPLKEIYPSEEEITEDLLLLDKEFDYIRLYDPSLHAKRVLEVIRKNNLNLKVMLGVDLLGEISNPNCKWGGEYTDDQLKRHIQVNKQNIQKAIKLANEYTNIIFSLSAGNEAVPNWNENLVSPKKVLEYVKELKRNTTQLITYCDGFNEWLDTLVDIEKEVDIISIHSYAAWRGYNVEEGKTILNQDYEAVRKKYPNKLIMVTETGWPTSSSNQRMKINNVGIEQQKDYLEFVNQWSIENDIIVFIFEAFDEPWKGGNNPLEPEKNWGLYNLDRKRKWKEKSQ